MINVQMKEYNIRNLFLILQIHQTIIVRNYTV